MRVSSPSTLRSLMGLSGLVLLATATACAGAGEDGPHDAPAAERSQGNLALDLVLPEADGASPLARAEACATGIAETKPLPAVVQMVVDTSGSMAWPPGWEPESEDTAPRGVASKWDITKKALTDAVSELSGDTYLGVNFYPNVAHSSTSCVKNEVAVSIGALGAANSTQRRHFADGLDGARPRGGTPTHAAYRFGLATLGTRALAGNGFILLITDGVPTYTASCAGDGRDAVDSAPLVAEAAAAFEKQGVRTFVIGSPGSESARSALSRVAQAGGTGTPGCSHSGPDYCHFDMTEGGDLGASLERALSDISSELTSCEYAIPAGPAGRTLDLDRVNVLRTSRDGRTEVLLQDRSGDCSEGWSYSSDRRRIVLCENTCRDAQRDAGTRVEVLFGCETETRAPR
jgi:hypothetical protein